MRTALYARVSTSDKGQDPEVQLRELREYCERRGWIIVGEYVDTCTGAKDRRPAPDRLMQDAKRRRIDAVLVWKLDRFGRSLRHLLNSLAEFDALGISFASYTNAIDTATPAGKLMFSMLGAFAEFERDLIRERVKAGIAYRRAKGLRVDRKPISMDPSRLQALRAQGQTIRGIADALGCSRPFVHKTLAELAA